MLSKYGKNKVLYNSPTRKDMISFLPILVIFDRKQGVVTISKVGIKTLHTLLQCYSSWATQCKSNFQFCGFRSQ